MRASKFYIKIVHPPEKVSGIEVETTNKVDMGHDKRKYYENVTKIVAFRRKRTEIVKARSGD